MYNKYDKQRLISKILADPQIKRNFIEEYTKKFTEHCNTSALITSNFEKISDATLTIAKARTQFMQLQSEYSHQALCLAIEKSSDVALKEVKEKAYAFGSRLMDFANNLEKKPMSQDYDNSCATLYDYIKDEESCAYVVNMYEGITCDLQGVAPTIEMQNSAIKNYKTICSDVCVNIMNMQGISHIENVDSSLESIIKKFDMALKSENANYPHTEILLSELE